jgi:hypothetical protein
MKLIKIFLIALLISPNFLFAADSMRQLPTTAGIYVMSCDEKYEFYKNEWLAGKISDEVYLAKVCEEYKSTAKNNITLKGLGGLGNLPGSDGYGKGKTWKYEGDEYTDSTDEGDEQNKSKVVNTRVVVPKIDIEKISTTTKQGIRTKNENGKPLMIVMSCADKYEKIKNEWLAGKISDETYVAKVCEEYKSTAKNNITLKGLGGLGNLPGSDGYGYNKGGKVGTTSFDGLGKENDKSLIKDMGADSQIKMQKVMDSKSKATEIMSNLMQKMSNVWGSIMGNLK